MEKPKTQMPEYRCYAAARGRCNNPRNANYKHYGGRGIQFRFESFEQFLEEVGPRPTPDHSIDRIDNEGHYEPGNVMWATRAEQAANRERQSEPARITRLNLKQLKERTGFTEYRIEKDMRLGLLEAPLPRRNTSENREWSLEAVQRYERVMEPKSGLTPRQIERARRLIVRGN